MTKKYIEEVAIKKGKRWKKNLLYILIAIISLILLLGLSLAIYVFLVIREVPPIDKWMEIKPSQTTIIYSSDNKTLGKIYKENRIYVPLYKISPYLQQAVVASEDKEFYNHSGVSLRGLIRAALIDLLHLEKKQGGSTITQQLAELLFLNPERTIKKKIKKIYIALQLERYFTKQQILEMYLNLIYWGHGVYGAETAAQFYFGKSAIDLNIPESALLAGIIPAPEINSPYRNPDLALKLRNIVIEKMYNLGYISEEDYKKAIKAPLGIVKRNNPSSGYIAPYFFVFCIKRPH